MSVHAVASRYLQGQTAEQIVADIPDIPLSHIHAAPAYYLANREQIDAEMAAEGAEGVEHDRLYEASRHVGPPERAMAMLEAARAKKTAGIPASYGGAQPHSSMK